MWTFLAGVATGAIIVATAAYFRWSPLKADDYAYLMTLLSSSAILLAWSGMMVVIVVRAFAK